MTNHAEKKMEIVIIYNWWVLIVFICRTMKSIRGLRDASKGPYNVGRPFKREIKNVWTTNRFEIEK